MVYLRYDTASQEVPLGPFVDSTDGNSEETGLTIANTDIRLWKAGATSFASKNDGGATHMAGGMYYAVLDATDTNTLGSMRIYVHVAGALAVIVDAIVLPQKVYDSLIAGSDNLEVDLIQIAGSAVSTTSAQLGVNVVQVSGDATAADNLELACDSYSETRGLAGTALPAAAADAAGGLPISDAGGLDIDTILGRITDARMQVLSDWINGGRLDLILDAIAGDVVNLDGAAMRGTDNAALAANWTATRAGYIDLLNTYLDAAISSRLATVGYTAPDNTNIGNIITAINHATYGLNALLTAINTRLATTEYSAPDNAGIATLLSRITAAVALASDLATVAGYLDTEIASILEDTGTTIPAQISGLNNLSSAQAQSAAAAALSAYDPPTKAEMDAGHALLATAASIAALNNVSVADVLTQATAALTAYDPPTKSELDSAVSTIRGADNDTLKTLSDQIDGIGGGGGDATAENQVAIIAHLEDIKGDTFSEATDSLEAIRNRGDAAWITGGGETGSNTVDITVTNGTIPIQDVKAEIWNSDESALVTYGTTDAEGVVNLTANAGTYRVRMIKGGYSFVTQDLIVDGNETETYTGTTRTPGAPESPDVCRLYEYIFLPDGTPPASLSTRAAVLNIDSLPFDDDSAIYSGAAIAGTYNATTGLIYWDVVQGAVVRVTINAFGIDMTFTVPTSATARISDI